MNIEVGDKVQVISSPTGDRLNCPHLGKIYRVVYVGESLRLDDGTTFWYHPYWLKKVDPEKPWRYEP